MPGETVIAKRTNSAFIGTDLESRLRAAGVETLIVAGVITNNSVEATVRMAGNLGFDDVRGGRRVFHVRPQGLGRNLAHGGRSACHESGEPGGRICHGGDDGSDIGSAPGLT